MNLTPILNKRYDLTFTLQWIGKTQDKLSFYAPHNFLKLTLEQPILGITKITNYNDVLEGETNIQYLKKYFKYRNNENNLGEFSDKLPIEEISNLDLNPCFPLDLELLYYFVYDGNVSANPPQNIYINSISINGNFEYQMTDSIAVLDSANNEIILAPKDIYKVFKLDDFDIVINSKNDSTVDVSYRVTQNGGRTYTNWEPLTSDNLRILRLDDMRFSQFQYLLKFNGSEGIVYVYDIILIGDFQNISANYLKSNRYGLKEDCITFIQKNIDSNINTSFSNVETNGLSCYNECSNSVLEELRLENEQTSKSELFNPYKGMDKMVEWANLLSNQMTQSYGWNVVYIRTDPDGNGTDKSVYEYTLKNTVDLKEMKVIVPENQFKDDHIQITSIHLDLFDTFEIYIMKDEFHKKFGIQNRPGRDDIIYLCPTNKLYYIKHSQAHRNIMNASIWYRVILEKYEDRKDIRKDSTTKEFLDSLTKFTTIEEVLGVEQKRDMEKIANKEQTYPTSFDKLRLTINKKVQIVKEKIMNGNLVLSNTHYNFLKLEGIDAIIYEKADQYLEKGYNRTIMSSFNISSEYSQNKSLTKTILESYEVKNSRVYNIIDNFDADNKLGYRVWYEKGHLLLQLNDKNYDLPFELMTNIWYSTIININQRQRKINLYVYKRNTDITITFFNPQTYEKLELITMNELVDAYKLTDENYTYQNAISDGFGPVENLESEIRIGSSNNFVLVSNIEFDIDDPIEFNHDKNIRIAGSNNFKCTNIRIFTDVIDENQHSNTLNQNIVENSQFLIFADNADKKLITTNYWNKNFK